MAYYLGKASRDNLLGVVPPLVLCVEHAITITRQDFGVFEGLRALERQKKLVAARVSRTLNSKHLPNKDGLSEATDLVPYIDGRLQWQMPACFEVIAAMQTAAAVHEVELVCGLVWDRNLRELDVDDLQGELDRWVARYQKTHPPVLVNGKWKKRYPLVDAPHFETVT